MIKVKYGQIRSIVFNPLLSRLLQSKMPFHCAKRVVDILHAVQTEQRKADVLWEAIQNSHLEPIDPHDEFSPAKIKEFLSDEDKEDAVKAINNFVQFEVELDCDPLPVEALEKIELTGEELMLLKGIIA